VRATECKSLPAYWLNSQRIGLLVGLLETGARRESFEPLVNEWSHASGGSKQGIGPAKIYKFIDSITAARHECHQYRSILAPPVGELMPFGLVTQLLLALLWSKSKTKSDLVGYYMGLSTVIPGITNSKFRTSTWIISSYTPDSKKLSEPTTKISNLYCIAKHFQRTVARAGTRVTSQYKFPAIVRVVDIPCYHWSAQENFFCLQTNYETRKFVRPTGQVHSVNDCMEATIRNFVEHLIIQPETGQFKLENLPPALRPIPALSTFFSKYTNSSSSGLYRTPEAGQDWFDLVQNLPAPVKYIINDRNELQPSFKNFVYVLNHLFGLSCGSLEDFLRTASTPGRCIRITGRRADTELGTFDLTFQYQQSHICAALNMNSNHATFSSTSTGASEPANTSDYVWNQLNSSLLEKYPHLAANPGLFQRMMAMLYMSLGSVNGRIGWSEPASWLLTKPNHWSLKSAFFLSVHCGAQTNKLPMLIQDAHDSGDPRMLKLVRNCLKFGDDASIATSKWLVSVWHTLQESQPIWNIDDLLVFSSSPLHEAARLGRLQLCKMLIEKRSLRAAAINADGYTAIQFAQDKIVKEYLQSTL
jgi:hypothetical protein